MVKRKGNKPNECKLKESKVIDPASQNLIYDEVDNFIDANNDNEDNDDFYATNARVSSGNAEEEQVLGLEEDTSSEESDEDDNLDEESDDDDMDGESDYEDEDDEIDEEEDENDNEFFTNDIVSDAESGSGEDDRFLGKQKKDFFGTDVPDQKIHNVTKRRIKTKNVKEIVESQMEGAKELQARMMTEISAVPSYSHFFDVEEEKVEELLPKKLEEIELSGQSNKIKTKKELKKIYRDFKPILSEINEITNELNDFLCPLMGAKKSSLLPQSSALEYLQTRYFLCLNYLNLLNAYLMVKCSEIDITNHPAEKRLAQCKHLFQELEPCKVRYGPELESLLSDIKSGKLKKSKKPKNKRKMLGVLQSKESGKHRDIGKAVSSDIAHSEEMEIEQENGDLEVDERVDDRTMTEEERRLITAEIKKNKGLMPSRKKDQRNPRVRYKNKYKHKVAKRKGQVRAVRREVDRYTGESTGIKADLIKSVKFK